MTLYDEAGGYPTLACDQVDLCSNSAELPESSVYTQNQVCFCKTLILDEVFDLLVEMIGVLQNAAVAQSNRVNFLSEWQKAYTDAMDQIHSFAAQNGDYYDNPSGDDGDLNSDLMSNLNQTNSIYTTTEQNRRQVVSDDAKALQTTVNQTSDAVNNQSSLATSFLQEMSTLLSTIFRSS
ncbi:MAG: hypothetical protein AAGG81_03785 [Chlamydiota bacterium]